MIWHGRASAPRIRPALYFLFVGRRLREKAVNDSVEFRVDVRWHINPLYGVTVIGSRIQDFGIEGEPSFVRQFDRNLHAPAYRFFMETLNETPADAQIVNSDRDWQHCSAFAVKRTQNPRRFPS